MALVIFVAKSLVVSRRKTSSVLLLAKANASEIMSITNSVVLPPMVSFFDVFFILMN